ncbi:MAG: hypothetical protein AAGN35_23230 [Bacteroidota bacterium]
MVKLVTFLLLFGATTLVAAPSTNTTAINSTMVTMSGDICEAVVDALLEMAADEWGTDKLTLWQEYRKDGITIKKIGLSPAGDDIYSLERRKTGGSLVLILDVEAL